MSKQEIEDLVAAFKAQLLKKSITVMIKLELNTVTETAGLFGEIESNDLYCSLEDSKEMLFTAITTAPNKHVQMNMHAIPIPQDSYKYHKIGVMDFWHSHAFGRIYFFQEEKDDEPVVGEIAFINYAISDESGRKMYYQVQRGWKEGIDLFTTTIQKFLENEKLFVKEHFNFQ